MGKTGRPLQVLPTLLQWMGNSKSFFPIPRTPNFSTVFCSFPLQGIPPHVSLYAQPWLFRASLHFTFATSLPSSLSRTRPSIWGDLLFPSCCLGHTTLMPFAGCEHFYRSQLSHPPSPGMLRHPAALLPKQQSHRGYWAAENKSALASFPSPTPFKNIAANSSCMGLGLFPKTGSTPHPGSGVHSSFPVSPALPLST